MKKLVLFWSMLVLAALACNIQARPATATPLSLPPENPTNTAIPSAEAPGDPTAAPEFSGMPATFDRLSLVIPTGLASGVSGTLIPRAEGDNVAPWEITPGNIQLKLEGYTLPDKFHQPQIFVYPAAEYATQNVGAAESIRRLQIVSANPTGQLTEDMLPAVPFFNAAQVFAAQIKVVPFQNGQGVRFLTYYAQGFGTVSNHELFYHFEGLTNDGKDYIIVILPVNSPNLPENGDPSAPIPAGGVPLPDLNDPNADWSGYFQAVTGVLNSTPPETFTPSLGQLDELVRSVKINP